MSACSKDCEARFIARKTMQKCSILADVSWPAKSTTNALPVISDKEREPIFSAADISLNPGEVLSAETRGSVMVSFY
jgi:hypothetical protein